MTVIVPEIHVFEPDELSGAVAELLAADIAAAIAKQGACRLGLAGGNTPRPIYEKLARPPLNQRIAWDKLHLFWGDERCVPPDHPSSNYAMVASALIDHVPIPADNVCRMEGERSPHDAAQRYIERLGADPIDILILGMGDDGHTASLFPGTPELARASERVIATRGPVEPHQRITLSMRAINESRTVYMLMTGEGKADRLTEVLQQIEAGAAVLPAAYVQPSGGRLVWLIDSIAARNLSSRRGTAQQGNIDE